ncbi:MAG TPA: class I SAM-dependent methyltransferase [Methylomirabilota bacterium]|nr:class I SAM-dependent methyltransferase [Methylomirabilota bacterium]
MRVRPQFTSGPPDPAKAVRWWSEDHYVGFESVRALRWLGVNWVKWKYRKFPDAYFVPATDVVELVKEMSVAGILSPLTKSSRVFEGGCNLGRNLWALREAFDCEVTGMDVSAKAIEMARDKIWKGRDRVTLHLDNLLTTKWFEEIPDGHFDLALTRWHLIHIPRSPEKSKYLAHMKRIAKTLLILEPVSAERTGTIQYQMGEQICHSWDDWAREYDLTEFSPRTQFENTAVFYSRRGREAS